MSTHEKLVYRFRQFELEPAERRLLDTGRPIALTPKVFDTLVVLVQRAGHLVSKDELMKTLWPRGYVEESNLTKHIWLIRRALGDGEKDPRFIETVPKLGYRFVAPVSSGAVPPDPPAEPPPSPPLPLTEARVSLAPLPPPLAEAGARLADGAGGAWMFAAAGIAWLAVLALAWRLIPGPHPGAAQPGRTVAVVGFSNLSRNAKDAWLAPALAEMLGTELGATERLQVLPDELVRRASTDLEAAAAGGYAPATLVRLRRRLEADYVVSGSYLVSGAAEDAPLRLDLAVQDTRSGRLLASVSSQSGLSGLLALITRAGASLRSKLGAGASAATLELLANEQPPSLDVARRLGFALDALHQYDAARARDELLEAVAESPGYAPAYTYLAQAWSALGYHDKALAAAEQAAQHALRLPSEQRLQAQAVAHLANSRWSEAAATLGELVRLKPLNPEYRLQLIEAQLAGGAVPAAQLTLRALRALPDSGADPRVELAAGHIAAALSDARGSQEHAARALRLAQQHDAAGLTADAQLALGGAGALLGGNEEARAHLAAAIAGYRAMRNPRGEAEARRVLAQALGNLDRGQEAREEYQRAMALDQGIGDLAGMARVYRGLCGMLWLAGDRDGAQAAARHALQLGRQTGDLPMQAWTLQALATIAADDAASDEVLSEYREVIALDERAGEHTAWPLANYADVQRMRGELAAARATCQRARAEAVTLSDPQFKVFSGFTCALIETDLGHGAAARDALEEVMREVGHGDASYRNNSLLTLAQLDMDGAAWDAARTRLTQASNGFAAAEERTGEADAQALLALCAEALGDVAARDAAVQRARTLRAAITSRQEVYGVDIALARLEGGSQANGTASERLLALAADAERRDWLGWALEAKLAAYQLLSARRAASAAALRADIEASARRHGYGRILRLLERPSPEPALARRS